MNIQKRQSAHLHEALQMGVFSLLVWLLFGWSAQTMAGELPTVAIITGPGQGETATLATSALGQSDKFALVERDDIDKILREHRLSTSKLDKSGALQIGQLLKADGVLLIQEQSLRNGPVLALRLIGVNSGVVLWSAYYPPGTREHWRNSVKERVEKLLPKLRTTAAEAVPISVAAVRSANRHSRGIETERDLRSLLIHRLAHEPALFVLERQHLNNLAHETQFDPEPEKFWTGSYVVEVQVSSGREKPEDLELAAQLTPPGAKQPITIACRGNRKNLQSLAIKLARRITWAVGKTPTKVQWDGAEDARKLLEEATWIYEAAPVASDAWMDATDTAWALGLRNDQITSFRIARLLSDSSQPGNLFEALEFTIRNPSSPAWGPLIIHSNLALAVIEKVSKNPPQFESPGDQARFGKLLKTLRAVLDEGHSKKIPPALTSIDSMSFRNQLAELERKLGSADDDKQIALLKELLVLLWNGRHLIGRGEISHDYLSHARIGLKQFRYNILVSFCRQPDVTPQALYEAYRLYIYEHYSLTLAEATELHEALLVAQKKQHPGSDGEFTNNKVLQYALYLETLFPTLSPPPQQQEISPDTLTISRISVLRLPGEEKPPRDFDAHYESARWHGDRLWLIAKLDGKCGILDVDVETNDAHFVGMPTKHGKGGFSNDRIVVTENAVFVARNYRAAPQEDGLYRYDRKSGAWRIYQNVYGLDAGYEPDLVSLGGLLYSTYCFDDHSARLPRRGIVRIDPASGTMEELTSCIRSPRKSPLDNSDYYVRGLFAGSDGLLYVKAVTTRDEDRNPVFAFSYSPKTEEWKDLSPIEQTAALPLNVDQPVLSAFGGHVYNWPGAGPEYWSDNRDSWHGQPTVALKYGDLQTNGIITLPLHFAPDLKTIRLHSELGEMSDTTLQRNIVLHANAWLLTPKGVLFKGGEPYWLFVSAAEVRAAARKLAASPGPRAPFWEVQEEVVSPDQKTIAFVSERDGNPDIFIANADGSNPINLTNSWGFDSAPRFSPDGKQIFYRTRRNYQSETNSIDIATREVHRVPR